MNHTHRFLSIVLFISLMANVIGTINYIRNQDRIQMASEGEIQQARRQKITDFLKLFMGRVLQAKGEVSFEDRLKLENAVRELGDPQILAQWQKFVDSKESTDAQDNLKELLGLLIKRL